MTQGIVYLLLDLFAHGRFVHVHLGEAATNGRADDDSDAQAHAEHEQHGGQRILLHHFSGLM